MSDTLLDIEQQKYLEWKEKQHFANQDYCNRDCTEHNEQCPYYDSEQECFDYDLCFKERGF